jgi:hypothetical protein
LLHDGERASRGGRGASWLVLLRVDDIDPRLTDTVDALQRLADGTRECRVVAWSE